jgi:hypothetical protein
MKVESGIHYKKWGSRNFFLIFNAILMEKLLIVLMSFILVLFLSLVTSCKKSDTDPVIDPFSDGTTERTMIVVMSDLHLGADLDYAECKENRAPLENLLNQIRVSQNVKELVIAGDLIDE